MSTGVYISVPYCRSKCTYCNFASGVFSAAQMSRYGERLVAGFAGIRDIARTEGAEFPHVVDSIYFGGGTPTLLQPIQLKNLFSILQDEDEFAFSLNPEVTVECAPGTLTEEMLETLATCGVNRVSLGVQSFDDREAASVGRLHTREKTHGDIARLRASGISNINIDLLAGLPHQTLESWNHSLDQAIVSNVPHVSVYMLEVDEESRLGRELIAGGTRYHAHFVPNDDAIAEFYELACCRLEGAGIRQYEISNFARPGHESRHNLKYWTREPYLGFGVDAHSMLPAVPTLQAQGIESVRFSTTDSVDMFLVSPDVNATRVTTSQAVEESLFLGLRMNRGVDLSEIHETFGPEVDKFVPVVEELVAEGLLERRDGVVRLTPRGRLLSNDVFERFILTPVLGG